MSNKVFEGRWRTGVERRTEDPREIGSSYEKTRLRRTKENVGLRIRYTSKIK